MSQAVLYIGSLRLCTCQWPPVQKESGAFEISTQYNDLVKRELIQVAHSGCPLVAETEQGEYFVRGVFGVVNNPVADLDEEEAQTTIMRILAEKVERFEFALRPGEKCQST